MKSTLSLRTQPSALGPLLLVLLSTGCGGHPGQSSSAALGGDRTRYALRDEKLQHAPQVARGCISAHQELLARAGRGALLEPGSAAETWTLAQKAAQRFESEPVAILKLFDEEDRSYLAQYWVIRQQLVQLEKAVDARLRPAAWREITHDYRGEALVLGMLPQVHPWASVFFRLRFVESFDEGVLATLDHPDSGQYALSILTRAGKTRLVITNYQMAACGIDRVYEGSVPAGIPVSHSGRSWQILSFEAVDRLWAVVDDPRLEGQELERRLAAVLEGIVNEFCNAEIARFPPGVVGVHMENWIANYGAGPSGDYSSGSQLEWGGIPVLTPTGVNPILTGGAPNPWSFGGR